MSEIEQLRVKVQELEQKYFIINEQYKVAYRDLDTAHAQIAVKDEALKANGVFHTPMALRKNGQPWDEYQIDAINRTREALTNSPAEAQRLMEDNRRMTELILVLKEELTPGSFVSRAEYEAVQKALSTTQQPNQTEE